MVEPLLMACALDVLTAPATITSIEYTFSISGLMLPDRRNRMSGQRVDVPQHVGEMGHLIL
jgi:hypothetical protein